MTAPQMRIRGELKLLLDGRLTGKNHINCEAGLSGSSGHMWPPGRSFRALVAAILALPRLLSEPSLRREVWLLASSGL